MLGFILLHFRGKR